MATIAENKARMALLQGKIDAMRNVRKEVGRDNFDILKVDGVFDTIKQIKSEGVTILLVEQNAHMALQIADRGYVLQSGEIAMSDTAANLRQNEMVQKTYLGID